LPLRAAARVQSRPRLFGDLDPGPGNRRMIAQDPMAECEAEFFDFARAVLARGAMDEILQRLARRQSVSLPLAKRRREVPFESERDREFLRIVAVPMSSQPEHAQARFAVTARPNPVHARNCTMSRYNERL